ncbi:MAG: hypothetical protein HQK83_06995 [Fibrobacteria bacterium]|nr:hypothetical protein [Fibrobacteria bacterium]
MTFFSLRKAWNIHCLYKTVIILCFLFLFPFSSQAAVTKLKVITWNIGAWNTLNWENSQLDQICEGLIDEQADLVGMGEVVHSYGGPGGVDTDWVTYIINYLDTHNYPMYSEYFPQAFTYLNTTGGLLMLSKYPIISKSEDNIGDINFLVRTTVQPNPGQDVHFFQSHLFSANSVEKKAGKIDNMLGFMNQYNGLKIVIGDMNFSPRSEPTNHKKFTDDGWMDSGIDFMGEELYTVDDCCHRPPGKLWQIDYVFLKDGYSFIESHVPYDNPNMDESDHWPLVATIKLRPPMIDSLQASITNQSRVNLSWNVTTSTDSIEFYTILRDGEYLATSQSIGFSDLTSELGESYTYQILVMGDTTDTLDISGKIDVIATPYGFEKVDERDQQVTKTNGWTPWDDSGYYKGGCFYSAITGESVEFTFHGIQVSVIGELRSDMGLASISIDGQWKQDIDCYSAKNELQALLYKSEILQAGEHTVKIEVKGTKNSLSSSTLLVVDAFEYLPWPDSVTAIEASPGHLSSLSTSGIHITPGRTFTFPEYIKDENKSVAIYTLKGSIICKFNTKEPVIDIQAITGTNANLYILRFSTEN